MALTSSSSCHTQHIQPLKNPARICTARQPYQVLFLEVTPGEKHPGNLCTPSPSPPPAAREMVPPAALRVKTARLHLVTAAQAWQAADHAAPGPLPSGLQHRFVQPQAAEALQ